MPPRVLLRGAVRLVLLRFVQEVVRERLFMCACTLSSSSAPSSMTTWSWCG